MKKYSIILVFLMLVMVLTGCGKNKTVENPINPTAPKVIEGNTGNKQVDALIQDVISAATVSDKQKVTTLAKQLVKHGTLTKEVINKNGCIYVFYVYMGKNYETNNCSK